VARFLLYAVGRDRPGIVAAVAGALADLGCNLEDTRMGTLRGQFAMLVVVAAPGTVDGSVLEVALRPIAAELDLSLALRHLPDCTGGSVFEGPVVVLSVRGADRPGIVAEVAGAVAAAGGSVVELESALAPSREGAGRPSYTMTLRVVLPPEADQDAFVARVASAARRVGVEVDTSQPAAPLAPPTT
jgi:glycine cleavage system transcriptional repressor